MQHTVRGIDNEFFSDDGGVRFVSPRVTVTHNAGCNALRVVKQQQMVMSRRHAVLVYRHVLEDGSSWE